jgi:hypothetical protein
LKPQNGFKKNKKFLVIELKKAGKKGINLYRQYDKRIRLHGGAVLFRKGFFPQKVTESTGS